jgi:hypothetical protein
MSQDQNLNPYAAPIIPTEIEPLDLNRECVLESEHTAAQQWSAAKVLADKSPLPMLSIFVMCGACFVCYCIMMIAMDHPQLAKNPFLPMATFAGSLGIAVAAFGGHFLLIRVLALSERSRIRANAVVGSLGPWQLTINQQQLTIRSWGGEQSWPVRPMCYVVHDIRPPILWLEPKLPIELPYSPLGRDYQAQHAHALLFEFAKNSRF